jgi:hypothetical protein
MNHIILFLYLLLNCGGLSLLENRHRYVLSELTRQGIGAAQVCNFCDSITANI